MPDISLTITELSGSNLTDYTVKVNLASLTLFDWNSVSSDGSDIYVVDSNSNPLYYFLESFDKSSHSGILWFKTNLNAYSSITVKLYYGGTNPYSSYRNAKNTFLIYDDFSGSSIDTTVWQNLTNATIYNDDGNNVLKLTAEGGEGSVTTITNNLNDVEIRYKLKFASFSSYGPRFLTKLRTIIEVKNEQGNLNGSIGYYNIVKNGTYDVKGSRTTRYTTNTWYDEYISAVGNTVTWKLASNSETLTHTNASGTASTIYIGTWDSGNVVYVDNFIVRKLVSPEPTVTESPAVPNYLLFGSYSNTNPEPAVTVPNVPNYLLFGSYSNTVSTTTPSVTTYFDFLLVLILLKLVVDMISDISGDKRARINRR